MSKRKVSKKQAWQIQKIQEERLKRAERQSEKVESVLDLDSLGPEQPGLLISHFGTQADIENTEGEVFRCLLRQNLGVLVAGDQVVWRQIDEQSGVVVASQPRQSVLGRPDRLGEMKPIAANIDQMIIVAAPQPRIVTTLIDSYLVAAELFKLAPVILLNKIDLLIHEDNQEAASIIELYEQLGYPVIQASVYQDHGLDHLYQCLRNKTSVLVGQSGVGKSSLISALLPEHTIAVGALKQGIHGSHTTSNSRLYHLPTGGQLIDSPGIREFGLWQLSATEIAKGFREFQPWLGRCKFRNCKHDDEPGCALTEAVKNGKIPPQRLANYHKIVEKIES